MGTCHLRLSGTLEEKVGGEERAKRHERWNTKGEEKISQIESIYQLSESVFIDYYKLNINNGKIKQKYDSILSLFTPTFVDSDL